MSCEDGDPCPMDDRAFESAATGMTPRGGDNAEATPLPFRRGWPGSIGILRIG